MVAGAAAAAAAATAGLAADKVPALSFCTITGLAGLYILLAARLWHFSTCLAWARLPVLVYFNACTECRYIVHVHMGGHQKEWSIRECGK